MAYVWSHDVTGFHTTEGRLSRKKSLPGLAWNSAKSIVSVVERVAAELFHGIGFVKKNIKLTRQPLLRLACVYKDGVLNTIARGHPNRDL